MTSASRWTRRPVVVAAGLTLLLAGCSGGGDDGPDGDAGQTRATANPDPGTATDGGDATETAETEAPADEGAEAEPGTYLPLQEGMEREWPEPAGRVSAKDEQAGAIEVFGVHRLDGRQAIVTGRLTLQEWSGVVSLWTEPGYYQPSSRGFEMSPFSLTTPGDDTTYLPVRDEEGWCLCSTLREPAAGEDQIPVWTVVTAPPEDATEVNVEVAGFGTVKDVPVTELPQQQTVPLGWAETLRVRSAEREAGQVRVRLALGNPTGTHDRVLNGYQYYDDRHRVGCFQALAAWGGSDAPVGHFAEDPECQRGPSPEGDQQVELEVLVGDPGSEELVLLPTAGLPVAGVPISGEPEEGTGPEVYPYEARTESQGATVAEGETVTVSLDAAVLFEYGEAELTTKADATLAEAVEALQGQEGRTITVAGHTDTQGDEDFNMRLSKDRAEAVAQALEGDLGKEWTVEVEWHGESQLAVPEEGTEDEVEAAQARNRRVEITVE